MCQHPEELIRVTCTLPETVKKQSYLNGIYRDIRGQFGGLYARPFSSYNSEIQMGRLQNQACGSGH